ncbi:unnamed protein product [Chilo suppressalis]|uniref:Immunoglobulin subtype domain-containing protein n=1 Tax=Chilo suppressalis TaxID=168631 RepID=A0ABN8EBF9_CHISP|nr:unnamed protein product [Chilo suppressalis]
MYSNFVILSITIIFTNFFGCTFADIDISYAIDIDGINDGVTDYTYTPYNCGEDIVAQSEEVVCISFRTRVQFEYAECKQNITYSVQTNLFEQPEIVFHTDDQKNIFAFVEVTEKTAGVYYCTFTIRDERFWNKRLKEQCVISMTMTIKDKWQWFAPVVGTLSSLLLIVFVVLGGLYYHRRSNTVAKTLTSSLVRRKDAKERHSHENPVYANLGDMETKAKWNNIKFCEINYGNLLVD